MIELIVCTLTAYLFVGIALLTLGSPVLTEIAEKQVVKIKYQSLQAEVKIIIVAFLTFLFIFTWPLWLVGDDK